MYITPGRNPVIELLRSDITCKELFVESDIKNDEKISEAIGLARRANIKVNKVSKKHLDSIVDKSTPHQGIIAIAESFSPELDLSELKNEPLGNQAYIYIREVQYEHNAAAIIRSADIFGLSGVILPPKFKVSPELSRIAMGANFHLPITHHSLFNTIKTFHHAGFQIVALEISGEEYPEQVDMNIPTLIIIGGEDKSISQEIIENVDHLIRIRQFGHVNSLNMSVAASVIMYERTRQLAVA